MALKKHRMMIPHKKLSYLEHKQKDLHLLLKCDPKLGALKKKMIQPFNVCHKKQ